MHVDAGVGVEEIEAFASRAFLVAVVLLVAVSVGVVGGAAAVVVAGVAGEYCGEVALEQGSERRRAGAHDAEIEFDGGPDEEVEADPAGVVGWGGAQLVQVVCSTYAGAGDAGIAVC